MEMLLLVFSTLTCNVLLRFRSQERRMPVHLCKLDMAARLSHPLNMSLSARKTFLHHFEFKLSDHLRFMCVFNAIWCDQLVMIYEKLRARFMLKQKEHYSFERWLSTSHSSRMPVSIGLVIVPASIILGDDWLCLIKQQEKLRLIVSFVTTLI